MKSNKIAIRLLLSITIIFAGLILLVGAKKEVHLYNLEEYELTAGSGAITFLATYDECATHNSIPQPTALKNLGISVFCIERGGMLNKYGIPDDLSDLVNAGDTKWINDLSKTKTKLYELVGIVKDWKSRRTSYKYTYDPSNLIKFKDLETTKTNYDYEKCGPEVAYIASCSPNNATGDNWSPEKQVAIWLSGIGNITNTGNVEDTDGSIFDSTSYPRKVVEAGIQLYAQAKKYQSFIDSGNHFRDRTNYSAIETEKVGDSYVIGPFNIEYNGTYTPDPACMSEEFWDTWFSGTYYPMCIVFNKVTFGGVSNFKLMLDLNGDGVCETPATIKGYGYTKNNVNEQFNLYYPSNANIHYGDKYVYNSLYYDGVYVDGDGEPVSGYKRPVTENNLLLDSINFPESGQNFYIKVDADVITGATSAKISGQYDWMNFNRNEGVTKLSGSGKKVIVTEIRNETSTKYDAKVKLQDRPDIQDLIAIKATRFIETIPFESSSTFEIIPPVMNIEGYVWNDIEAGKESTADGIYTSGSNDKPLNNVKVTLYYSNGTMVPQSDLNPIGATDITFRINPTLTKEDGYYMFAGLDTTKSYYVEYEYEGQRYIPTDHTASATGITSKSVELGNARTTLDNRFAEIKSSPKSYTSQNNLGFNITDNITFTRLDLMGYKLTFDETTQRYKYVQDQSKQLIDGYLYNDIGQQTSTYRQGIITTKIKQYIGANNKFPNASALRTIYENIAGDSTELKQKLQFIEDCKIKATTASKSGTTFNRKTYSISDAEYDTSESILKVSNVNLGLCNRQVFDLHLWNDASVVDVRVNGRSESYNYDGVFTQNSESYGNVCTRLNSAISTDKKYNNPYFRNLYKSDYNVYGYDNDNSKGEIEVYIKYRIEIYNESLSVIGKVTEIVDNYLNTLEYVAGSVEAKIGDNNIDGIRVSNRTRYSGTEEIIDGYNRLYITGLENTEIASGQSLIINLTFKAKTTDGHLDSNTTKNIAEINGFKTFYKQGTELPNGIIMSSSTTPGLIDWDSLPGNLENAHLQGSHYEINIQDDTDISHTINTRDEGEREISGTVWEDRRTEEVSGALIGDGEKDNDETRVQGVQVTLKELVDGEYVTAKMYKIDSESGNGSWEDAIMRTDENGAYSFKGVLPGEYIVQFDYGDSDDTVLTSELTNETILALNSGNSSSTVKGLNINSYNGQDYKSTIFQAGIRGGYNVQELTYNYRHDNYNNSKALDVFARRDVVNNYSKTQTNHIAEVLASPYNVPKYPKLDDNGNELYDINNKLLLEPYSKDQMRALIDELIENTKMTAITPKIILDIEYNRMATSGNDNADNQNLSGNNKKNGQYKLENLDFGLVERPRAQLEIEKEVENVKVTLSDGTILFDNTQGAKNIVWQDNKEWDVRTAEKDLEEESPKYNVGEYRFRTLLGNKLPGANKTGLIQVIIDNELMYGATIQIIYNVTVKNVGEVDYGSYEFYAKGTLANNTPKSTTSADQVICYVPNNMQFDKNLDENIDTWDTVEKNTLTVASRSGSTSGNITDDDLIGQIINGETTEGSRVDEQTQILVNNNLKYLVDTYNTIISTQELKQDLEPIEDENNENNENNEKSIKLVLSELMTKSAEDDLNYESIVEIVKTTNTVGRRMSYSVVGNQNPQEDPAEVDASKGEKVQVLPPFGTSKVMYYALTIAVVAILGIGIYLIKKNVVKEK